MTTRQLSQQIANAISSDLSLHYFPHEVEKNLHKYIWLSNNAKVYAFVRIEKVSWYQCEIMHLWVHPDYRRAGIGMRMLDLARREAKEKGCNVLQATTVMANVPVIKLNQQFGFVKVNEFVNPRTGHILYVWQKTIN